MRGLSPHHKNKSSIVYGLEYFSFSAVVHPSTTFAMIIILWQLVRLIGYNPLAFINHTEYGGIYLNVAIRFRIYTDSLKHNRDRDPQI